MCGRFSLSLSHAQIHHVADHQAVNLVEANWIDQDEFRPRYNIAPRSNAPVIRRNPDNNDELIIHTMKWGVVPHWSKFEDTSLNTINARAENLVESGGMWASIKSKKRCLVVCDGYFEWLKKGKDRLPHFIRMKNNKPMILAGLYDSVLLEGATKELWTFTIVTTDAASSMSWLHDRQPVILSSPADLEAWLDTSQGWHKGLVKILKAGDGKELECYPVPKEVGRVGANSPEFIKPVSQRKDGIEAMFARQIAKKKQTPQASLKHASPGGVADTAPTPSGSSDGTSAKRAIDVDASPSSSLTDTPPPKKKQKRNN